MLINLLNFLQVPKRRSTIIWSASLGVGGLLYLKVWLPLTGLGVPCVFRHVTGLLCPGCGITRATISMLQLEVYQAFRFNPIVFCLLPLALVYMLARYRRSARLAHIMMVIMVGITLCFGVLRNIPLFSWLAPTPVG